ncbi:MAG TPA: GGDEF domain-containing protein [Azonexus sp.]|nr:GGDEF domain-containing protein [Azonexus sp.]
MNKPKNPSEIAREALTRLAASRLPPTPSNYQACYNEIANLPNISPFPEPQLRQIATELSGKSEVQKKQLASLDAAISRHSWLGVRESLLAFIAAVPGSPARSDAEQPSGAVLPPEFSTRLARLVESVLPALGDENERVLEMADGLLALLRQPSTEITSIQGELVNFSRQVLFAAEEQVEIKDSLLKLLHLIIENIGELSLDDSWLKGQIDGLLAAVAPPLTLRHLDEMERRLRDVMVKQSEAKNRSVEAQEELRLMLAAFIERLATMGESSTTFQGRIEASAREIEQVKKIEDLAPLLQDVIATTRIMVEETSGAREQLKGLQSRVLATEAELVQLHLELDNASALARHDPLTDTLNRKGLDEALAREIAGARRKDSLLSVCLLDIDNFKTLNDRLGHDVGDDALIHLVKVTRSCMRPSDTLARYGGEEFVILMPDTPLENGIEAMVRLQRELTKAFFLSGKERVLITFSAGVAQLAADETGADAIKRADQAMYLAKRAGKNRVLSG